MKTHQVDLIVTVEDPTEEYKPVNLPLDIYQALTDGWKSQFDGDPWWISQISSRDTYGRIAVLTRANAEQVKTIESLDLTKKELKLEQKSLKAALARKDNVITALEDKAALDRGIRATAERQADLIGQVVNNTKALMKIVGISHGWGNDEDLSYLEAHADAIKGEVEEMAAELDAIRTLR